MKKFSRRLLLTLLALVGIVMLVVMFGISPFAKYYIETHGKELIGRRVTVDELKINLLNGKLNIGDFTLYEADDTTPFVALDRFSTDVRLLALLGRKININYIDLVRPDIHIAQQGSTFNFDDMVAHFRNDTTAVEKPATEKNPWIIDIDSITIRNGQMLYEDRQVEAQWDFNNLNLYIPSVYFAGKDTDIGITLSFAEGGSLLTSLAYNLESNDFDLSVELDKLALSTVLPYFRQTFNVSAVEGALTADMNLTGNLSYIMGFSVAGTADVENFRIHDMQQREVIALEKGHVKIDSVDFVHNSFHFNRLAFEGLKGSYELFADSTNTYTGLWKAIDERGEEADAAVSVKVDSTEHDPLKLYIREADLKRSSFYYADHTLHRPFTYQVSNITLMSRNFDLDAINQLTGRATLQSTGSASLRWQGSFKSLANHNITLNLSNVAMQDFTTYCEAFTAHPITGGNLTFESQNIITDYELRGTNHLNTYQFAVEKKLKEIDPVVKLPLKLGVYVLTDKQDHIDLDLPVKGRIDDPEFSYRKIIFKALGNVLLKVATAPFSFLKGGGDKGFSAIDIKEPHKASFNAEQYASFDKIASTLKEKPEMRVTLSQLIDREVAEKQMALYSLKAAYYKQDLGDTTMRLEMVDYDQINQIKSNSSELAAFADAALSKRGLSAKGQNTEEKAVTLYGEQAKRLVSRLAVMRDHVLNDYMLTKQQVSPEQFRIAPYGSDSLSAPKGRHRYAISMELEGEQIALDAPQEEAVTEEPIPTEATEGQTVEP
ncbi:MAG: DUF748 domain-containing protein [Alistipes sp.]|nr:DUF748 domain-containing protein [Alistipes sp.]